MRSTGSGGGGGVESGGERVTDKAVGGEWVGGFGENVTENGNTGTVGVCVCVCVCASVMSTRV